MSKIIVCHKSRDFRVYACTRCNRLYSQALGLLPLYPSPTVRAIDPEILTVIEKKHWPQCSSLCSVPPNDDRYPLVSKKLTNFSPPFPLERDPIAQKEWMVYVICTQEGRVKYVGKTNVPKDRFAVLEIKNEKKWIKILCARKKK